MKPEIHNLRRRIDARGAWVLVPAALAMLVAVGVTTPHAVELASLNAGAMRASSDAMACTRLRAGVQAFEAAKGQDRAHAAIALAQKLIPKHCTTVELHSAVRLAAALCDWNLTMLSVSEPVALDLPGSGDGLARRNVEVSGLAALSGVPRLVRSLAAHGYPTRVLSLTLTRENAHSSSFETHALLAMFHSVPPIEISAPQAIAAQEKER